MFFIIIKAFVVIWLILSIATSIVMDTSALYAIILIYSFTTIASFIFLLSIFLIFPKVLYGFFLNILLFIILVLLKFLSISYM
ncbi:MAG: hypothetical protein ACTSR0_03055 [Candidatus Asgardarchaeia archaeon]